MADGQVVIDIDLNSKKAYANLSDFKKALNEVDGSKFDKVESSASRANTGIKQIVTSLGLMKVATAAVDMLKSSLSGAISRYDTLNNYPKVMQSLGFSAEEAAASSKKLSDGIQGLPTTLDSISSNTQFLVSSLGDLDKATDLSIALNNMFLASGKGAAEADRAFQQFTQMLSKGKVDMQSWQTMMEVAPGQLNQLSEKLLGAGNDGRALYSALQDGTVTFDEFVNEIIKSNDGLSGFAEQAKNATGGIATSFTNLKSSVVRGLANMIGAIDEWLSSNNLPKISEMINIVKDDIDKAFNLINENMDSIMPVVETIVRTLMVLAPLVLTVAAAVEVYNAVQAIKTAMDAAEVTSLTALIAAKWADVAATIAALAPYIAIAAAIAAVVAIIVVCIQHWDEIKAKVIEVANSVKEQVVTAWNDVKQAFDDLKQWISDTWDSICQKTEDIWNSIKSFFTVTIPEIYNTVVDWFQQLPGRIWGFFTDIWNKAVQWGSGLLSRGVEAATSFINGVINWFAQLPGRIWDWLTNALNNVISWGSNLASQAKTAGSNMVNSVINAISSLPGKLLSWGADAVHSFAQGIKNAIGAVIDAAKGVADAVASFLHFSEPDIGPLSNASTFMPDMMKLYAKGIKDNLPMLQKAAMKAADALAFPAISTTAELSASTGYPDSRSSGIISTGVSIIFNGGIQWSGENDIETTMDLIQDVITRRGYRLG